MDQTSHPSGELVAMRRLSETVSQRLSSLRKAHGEGSHGGKVIGHTKSGKPIYEAGHPSYRLFQQPNASGKYISREASALAARAAHPTYTRQDHLDAEEAHSLHELRSGAKGDEAYAMTNVAYGHARAGEKGSSVRKSSEHHGEGSHGGHIIGHTRSGKPIYSLRHDMNYIKGGRLAIAASHHLIGYTPDDFADAAARHMEKFVEHRDKMPKRAGKHLKLAQHLARTATEKGSSRDKMQMSGLKSSHGNHASLAAFHLREAEAKRKADPAEALWHYGQVGLHSSAAIAARHGASS